MARLSRLIVAEQLHFVWQRGLGSPALFMDAQDHVTYLSLLARWARVHKVAVHAYALLPHDIYLLVTPHALSTETGPSERCGLSVLMQALGRDHVAAYNRRHLRTGTLWHGRFRVGPVDAARHWRSCVQYIEQAAVRQGLAPSPGGYPWSSAPHHLGHARSEWLVEHPQQWTLGNTPFEREANHRVCLAEPLDPAEQNRIEASVLKGWALGPAEFIAAMQEKAGDRRVQPASRGRPRKTPL
ncbi:MAG: transposase [Pseudomonadota bacterium]